jgi:hypothetical protein
VVIPFPEAAIDVDSVRDWELVEEIVSNAECGMRNAERKKEDRGI